MSGAAPRAAAEKRFAKTSSGRVVLGGALIGLIGIAVVVANDDRLEVGRLSRELCGTYLSAQNYFAIFITDIAWLGVAIALALVTWAFLVVGVRRLRSDRHRVIGTMLWWVLAAATFAVVFVASEGFVDWYAADFARICPNGPA